MARIDCRTQVGGPDLHGRIISLLVERDLPLLVGELMGVYGGSILDMYDGEVGPPLIGMESSILHCFA